MPDSCAVIGAGPAGVSAAEALRDLGFTGRLTLIGAERHVPYYRPALSKEALLDEPRPAPVPLRAADFYLGRDIDLRLGTTATRLDPDRGVAHLASGERLRADTFVLATGSSPRLLGTPGDRLPGVFVLRTADDAAGVRSALDGADRVVVIGGGFIGTEVAAAAATRGHPTTIVEAGELPMSTALGPDVARLLAAAHRRRGVALRTNAAVLRLEGEHRVTGVRLSDGELLPADLVVIGIGARPNTALAVDAGLGASDGIHIDRSGRTSHPAVFAAGDVAAVRNAEGARVRGEHWQLAQDSGVAAATAILGLPATEAPTPWFWSDQFDLNVQLAGRPGAADARSWRGDPDAGSFAVLHHRDGLLTGAIAVNRGQDVRPAIELIRRGIRVEPERLADTGTPLRKLLKAAAAQR